MLIENFSKWCQLMLIKFKRNDYIYTEMLFPQEDKQDVYEIINICSKTQIIKGSINNLLVEV